MWAYPEFSPIRCFGSMIRETVAHQHEILRTMVMEVCILACPWRSTWGYTLVMHWIRTHDAPWGSTWKHRIWHRTWKHGRQLLINKEERL